MGIRPAPRKSRTITALVAGVTVSALVTGGGFALAAMPSTATGDITSCISKSNGAVRVIDFQAGKRCASGESTLSWSKGFVFRGAWSASASYVAKDLVTYNGSSYLAKAASRGATPGSSTAWAMLAAKGDTGLAGPKGNQGPQGVQGLTGDTGAAGAQGTQGAAGAQGTQGAAGSKGVDGVNGVDGQDGAKGETGAEGIQGQAGATGAKGDTGNAGAAGANGNTILSGTGAPAATAGSVGDFYLDLTSYIFYGPKSATAGWSGTDVALKGPKGDKGDTGAQGAAGIAGPTGAAGPAGANGTNGTDGADGATGPKGDKGDKGDAGPTLFTASVTFSGLSASTAPAYDSVNKVAGCWGAVTGHSAGCLNKYDSALMTGSGGVKTISAMYVRAPGLDPNTPLTVSLLSGSSPANMSATPTVVSGQNTGGTPVTCSIDPAGRNCYSSNSFNYLSDWFLGLQVSTTSQTPLSGTVFVTFTLS